MNWCQSGDDMGCIRTQMKDGVEDGAGTIMKRSCSNWRRRKRSFGDRGRLILAGALAGEPG